MSTPPDPFLLTVLSQGVTFLFGEAGKILEERRTSRQKHNQEKISSSLKPKPVRKRKSSSRLVTVADDLQRIEPKTLSLRDVPQEINHYMSQIHQYRENLRLLDAQTAVYGGFVHAPLITQNQIKTAEQEIYENYQKLKQLIEEVYDREIVVYDLDEQP